MRGVTSSSFSPCAAWAAIACLALVLGTGTALAQSGDLRAQEQTRQGATAPADAARDNQRKVDEFAEAAQAIGGPAGQPECVWLGRRVVGLMWRDDLDTAFRHLDLYDRFGCPGGHVQAAFRCLTRFGAFDPKSDPKALETLNGRTHACWVNPALQPQPAATTASSPAAVAAPAAAQGAATPAPPAPPAAATK